jgi:rod shape-determining protein MreC
VRGSGRLRLLLVLLVLTAFTLTALDFRSGSSSPFDAIRRGSDTIFGPAINAVGGAARSVGDAVGSIPRIGRYSDENKALQADNDRLRARLRETDGLRRQVDEWNALMKLKDAGSYTVVPAHVSSVGSSLGFEWTATLDAGSADGVRPDQTVVSGKGLVGRVKRVGRYTSTVVLVVDREFRVGVRVLRTGKLGIVTGHGLSPLSYELLGQDSRADVGDAVYTSGSATFVPGVPVGRITSTDSDPNSLTRTGSLDPYVDVTALDLVGVVVELPRGTPRVPVPPTAVPMGRPTAAPSP